MKAVEVAWYDIASLDAWMSANDITASFPVDSRGQLVRTRGWLYREDEHKIIVVTTYAPEVANSDEESVGALVVIPKGVISEVIEQGE